MRKFCIIAIFLTLLPMSGAWAAYSIKSGECAAGTYQVAYNYARGSYACETCPSGATCSGTSVTCPNGSYATALTVYVSELSASGKYWLCESCSNVGEYKTCEPSNSGVTYSGADNRVTCKDGYGLMRVLNRCSGNMYDFYVKRCIKCPYNGSIQNYSADTPGDIAQCYLGPASGTRTDSKGDFTISSGQCYISGATYVDGGGFDSYNEFDLPSDVKLCYSDWSEYFGYFTNTELCLCNGYN